MHFIHFLEQLYTSLICNIFPKYVRTINIQWTTLCTKKLKTRNVMH